MRLLPCCLFLLLSGLSMPAAGQDTVAEAVLVQQDLPALQARLASAEARALAAQRYFAGELALGAAFPDLDGAPIDSGAFLAGRLHRLDRAGQLRAVERVEVAPGLTDKALERWLAGRSAALDAEEQADALERRLLLALQAGLDRAPELRQEALAEQRAAWGAQRAGTLPEAGPEREAALDAATRAGEAQAALARLQRAAWRAMTVPGDPALAEQVEAELAVTGDDQARREERADRLRRVLPLLDETLRARVRALLDDTALDHLRREVPALQARLDARQAGLDGGQLGEVGTVEQAQAALAAAQQALAALPEVAAPTDVSERPALEAERARLVRALAALEVQEAEARLARARAAVEAALQQGLTAEEVDEARRRADESKLRAETTSSEEEARVRGQLAELQRRIADELQAERTRHESRAAELQAHRDELDAARAEAAEAVALPVLAAGRAQRIDAALVRLRLLVEQLRNAVAASREDLSRTRTRNAELRGLVPDTADLPDALRQEVEVELTRAESDLERLLALRESDSLQELDWAIQLLTVAKVERRGLRPEASARAQQRSLGDFTSELRREALEAPVIVEAQLRNTLVAIRELPAKITDVNAVASFLTRSFELVLLGILWVMLRRNAESWARRGLAAVWRQQQDASGRLDMRALAQAGWMVEGDVRGLAQPLAPLLFSIVDLSVAWGLFRMTREGLPTLALLILLWLARSIVKAAPRLVPILFAPPDTQRPALRVLETSAIERLQRSVRVVAFSFVAVALLRFIALGLFEADRFNDLVSVFRVGLYLGVALWLLEQWSESIRSAVSTTAENEKVVARLATPGGNVVLRLLRAAGGLGYLLWRGAAELLVRVAEGRPSLSWLASALARARLRSVHEEDTTALGADVQAALAATRLPVPRPEAITELGAAMAAWLVERRRGMVAVVGARGAGKSVVLDAIPDLAAQHLPDVPVTVLQLDARTYDPQVALRWLARATGVHDAVDGGEESLIAALSGQPPRVFVVPAMHRLALRAVGGFSAVQAVMRVMQATGEEHFWVCGFHSATWSYLAGVASSMNLEAFRLRLQLKGLGSTELGTWARQRAALAGYELSFAGMLGRTPAGLDATKAIERAEQAYWRLLADASMGIPEVAWGYLRSSLRASRTPGALDVQLFQAPTPADLESLPDLDLFVLTAIVIHDELDTASIGEVLNAPVGQVLEACRHLDGLEVLDHADERQAWHILPRWRPAVERILRQKHFLYMR